MPRRASVDQLDMDFTSRDASRLARLSVDAGTLRGQVLARIRAARGNGMTCDEVEVASGLTHQCASARVCELAKAGLIYPGGNKRLTRQGRYAVVWVAK